ncbi:MAG TPA: hypothetical protein VME42_02845 [Steroidobacteraceae bacterium]|nr:hypothetical protein [Steroidobacteraceae bacterium]
MKVPSRKAASASEQRRHHRQAERAQALTVREAFPNVGAVHVELSFDDHEGPVPSPQRHSLYPAARAFFRFACPCADCDGEFDLTDASRELLRADAMASEADACVAGRISCQGTRLREKDRSAACGMELRFRLVSVISAEPAH